MLIETSSTVAHDVPAAHPAPVADHHGAPEGAEIAAHDARTARIDRALGALDDLARLRRTHELVEAIERLGAGLGSTMTALDDALGTAVHPDRLALEAPAAWEPISAPLVPITAFVAPPATGTALVPAPVVAAPVAAPRAPVTAPVAAPASPVAAAATPVAPAQPGRERRQAPAGLAAFVIDFPEIDG